MCVVGLFVCLFLKKKDQQLTSLILEFRLYLHCFEFYYSEEGKKKIPLGHLSISLASCLQ